MHQKASSKRDMERQSDQPDTELAPIGGLEKQKDIVLTTGQVLKRACQAFLTISKNWEEEAVNANWQRPASNAAGIICIFAFFCCKSCDNISSTDYTISYEKCRRHAPQGSRNKFVSFCLIFAGIVLPLAQTIRARVAFSQLVNRSSISLHRLTTHIRIFRGCLQVKLMANSARAMLYASDVREHIIHH